LCVVCVVRCIYVHGVWVAGGLLLLACSIRNLARRSLRVGCAVVVARMPPVSRLPLRCVTLRCFPFSCGRISFPERRAPPHIGCPRHCHCTLSSVLIDLSSTIIDRTHGSAAGVEPRRTDRVRTFRRCRFAFRELTPSRTRHPSTPWPSRQVCECCAAPFHSPHSSVRFAIHNAMNPAQSLLALCPHTLPFPKPFPTQLRSGLALVSSFTHLPVAIPSHAPVGKWGRAKANSSRCGGCTQCILSACMVVWSSGRPAGFKGCQRMLKEWTKASQHISLTCDAACGPGGAATYTFGHYGAATQMSRCLRVRDVRALNWGAY